MPTASQMEALRWVVEVRWRLLESYALARQEGFVEPIGLVIDASYAYGRELAQHLLVGAEWPNGSSKTVTCMERADMGGILAACSPELALALRGVRDEPGRWAAVILAQRGWVLTGTWQELMTATVQAGEQQEHSSTRRR